MPVSHDRSALFIRVDIVASTGLVSLALPSLFDPRIGSIIINETSHRRRNASRWILQTKSTDVTNRRRWNASTTNYIPSLTNMSGARRGSCIAIFRSSAIPRPKFAWLRADRPAGPCERDIDSPRVLFRRETAAFTSRWKRSDEAQTPSADLIQVFDDLQILHERE